MKRDMIRAELEDAIRASIEEKIEAYEKLAEKANISAIETFDSPHGEVVYEVKRRIGLTKLLAEDAGMDSIAKRADSILKSL